MLIGAQHSESSFRRDNKYWDRHLGLATLLVGHGLRLGTPHALVLPALRASPMNFTTLCIYLLILRLLQPFDVCFMLEEVKIGLALSR